MPRLLSALLLLVALTLVSTPHPAHGAAPASHRHWVRIMLQFTGSPLAADTNLKVRDRSTLGRFRLDTRLTASQRYLAALAGYQASELRYLRSIGIDVQVIRRFRVLFDGFSALVPSDQLARLRSLANVSAVLPDRMIVRQDDRSLQLVHAPQAWSQLGGSAEAGRRLYIADVDTGIDNKNPCFRDTGMPAPALGRRADNSGDLALTNNKIVVARAFGSYPGTQYSALDVVGHGTFTAAVEACDYSTPTPLGSAISGIAPAAYLMIYNINPSTDDGQGPEDAAIAAFEAALQDGADVVNFSYGSVLGAGDPRLDAETAAVNLATKAGLTMVVSAGNAGPGVQTVSSPSTAESAISVGASTNSRAVSESIYVTGPGTVPTSLAAIRAKEGSHPFTTPLGPASVVDAGLGRRPTNDPDHPDANDFTGKDLHGKIALIERGGFAFETKINNAAQAGAIGVIVYNNRFELSPPGMDTGTATLPAMAISQDDGKALLAWLAAHPDAQVVLDPKKHSVDETPNVLSDFSSRGYGPDYRIKPDLVAPGEDIYSAVQTDKPGGELYDSTGFASADGTSFSAPHVTGAVALLLQKHPTWTPAMVKAVLMETASAGAISVPGETTPRVMEIGAGLLDIGSALSADSYVLPASVSFGQANVGYGDQTQSSTLTLNDAGVGAGNWSVTSTLLHGANGLTVSVPSTVTLPASGHTDLTLRLGEAAGVPPGDYDGYLILQHGSDKLHVPFFVHVASKAVAPGTVLLVDASTTRYQPEAPLPAIKHLDVSQYYEQALTSIGRSYTYWDDSINGAPSLADMKRASTVIYFTGTNINYFAHDNSNFEALDGPLNSIDLSSIHSYLDSGGRVFLSGMGVALSDLDWDAFVLGAQLSGLSEFDNSRNDKNATGGISPPQPSAVVENRSLFRSRANPYVFAGLKAIDFSTKGDGAGDNLAINSAAAPNVFANGPKLVGVTDLDPFASAKSPFPGATIGGTYGKSLLRTADLAHANGNGDIAIANSDEPSFTHQTKYHGRTILFSFGFEGINNNTGYATREQVLSRIFAWFTDTPSAAIVQTRYTAHRSVTLRASLHAGRGVHPARYLWEVNGKKLKATTRPTSYTFPRSGTYRLRVQVTDSLGHVAVSSTRAVTFSG